jgi:hypothetical protein
MYVRFVERKVKVQLDNKEDGGWGSLVKRDGTVEVRKVRLPKAPVVVSLSSTFTAAPS